jgi:hydrogenase maturation protease
MGRLVILKVYMSRTLIVGIGNYIMSDDAAGIHAVGALRESYTFPEEVELIDGGTKGIELLPYLEDCRRLMLIDAVDFREPPGTVKVIEGDKMKAFLDLKFSVHQIGIPDMLFALDFKGIKPPQMCLVGIQPASLETGTEMTEAVSASFGDLLDAAISRLGDWGVEARAIETGKERTAYRYVPGNPL